MSVVLDASAILAVLLDEAGAEIVIPVMRGSALSAVNASETFQRAADKGHKTQRVLTLLKGLEIEVVPFTMDHAIAAADLRPATKAAGISLGDRACLALAAERRATVYTGDRRLAGVDIGLDLRLIR
ncbi:type II toxin-antitoxin system VapC family toxin [Sphingomonas sp. RB3P16]|uniref:type II toxin-antitoxin system VapC family toxin n=1 Tax=Parasphingomonas frigoris TaxID=3096163 RepID=UPI002FC6B40D